MLVDLRLEIVFVLRQEHMPGVCLALLKRQSMRYVNLVVGGGITFIANNHVQISQFVWFGGNDHTDLVRINASQVTNLGLSPAV